jgi:hypothetical protein
MDIYSEKKAMKDLNSLYAEAVYGKPKSAGQELASREKRDDAAGAPKKMIVTRADKKANTKAYQNYKAGAKGYAAADHLKNEEYAELYATMNEKKADKDYDGDGKVESGKEEYFGSKDKAIKKAMGKKVKEDAEYGYDSKGRSKNPKDIKNRKVKESFSNWRNDISEVVDEPEATAAKKVKESNVKNKVVIDPEVKLEQALGGEVETIEEDKNLKIKEEILWDRVAEALDELGEMNDVQFKVSPMTEEEILELNWDVFDENYQAMRNPEKEEKKDKRSAREKRMADPEKGINSPAFKEFMKQYGG